MEFLEKQEVIELLQSYIEQVEESDDVITMLQGLLEVVNTDLTVYEMLEDKDNVSTKTEQCKNKCEKCSCSNGCK